MKIRILNYIFQWNLGRYIMKVWLWIAAYNIVINSIRFYTKTIWYSYLVGSSLLYSQICSIGSGYLELRSTNILQTLALARRRIHANKYRYTLYNWLNTLENWALQTSSLNEYTLYKGIPIRPVQWPIDSYIASFGIVAFRIVSQESYEYLSSPGGPSPYPGSKSSNSPKYQTSNGVGVALECLHVVLYRRIVVSTYSRLVAYRRRLA